MLMLFVCFEGEHFFRFLFESNHLLNEFGPLKLDSMAVVSRLTDRFTCSFFVFQRKFTLPNSHAYGYVERWIWMVLLRSNGMTLIFCHVTVHHLSWSFVLFFARLYSFSSLPFFYFKTNLQITKPKDNRIVYGKGNKTTTHIQNDEKTHT